MTELSLHSGEQMMSSREIAALTGKRHDNILRDCDKLNEHYEKMSLLKIEERDYLNTRNQKQRECLLTKVQTFDLMAGYNIEFRIKIIRRWEELEKIEQSPDLVIARGYEALMQKVKVLNEKIQEDKPKVDYVDATALSHESLTMEDFCSLISKRGIVISAVELGRIIRSQAHAFRRRGNDGRYGKNTPSMEGKRLGYVETKKISYSIPEGGERTTTQLMITVEGQVYYNQLIMNNPKFNKDMSKDGTTQLGLEL